MFTAKMAPFGFPFDCTSAASAARSSRRWPAHCVRASSKLPALKELLAARNSFKAGNLELALTQWAGHLRDERAALAALVQSKGNPNGAIFAVNMDLKKLLVSALQSHLFNQVLERRLPK